MLANYLPAKTKYEWISNVKQIFENWRKHTNEAAYEPDSHLTSGLKMSMGVKELAQQLTNNMHAKWLAGYRKENGDKPRFKPIPDNPPIEKLQGFEGVEVVDGTTHQNINQEADKIVPSLAHKLNGAPSVDYAFAVENLPESPSVDDIENLSSEFHEIWMKHNSWQKDSNPSLFVDYTQLPADEKRKDLDQLKVALNLAYRGNEDIMQLFNQVYRSTT